MTGETTAEGGLRQKVGLFLGPALFALALALPAPEGLEPEAWRVAAVAVLMIIWWISEAIPIPATALLPIVLFPVLRISEVGDATRPFANPLIFLFLGGFVIALGMEKSKLHRRIALKIIHFVGTKPASIIFGMMIAAAFLSMWVSNTATALMMLPIALSIIALVERDQDIHNADLRRNFALVLLLSLAYACNLGGIATLIGTPPNALMAAFMLDNYDVRIGFAQWMALGVPLVAVSLPLVYLVLNKLIFPVKLAEIAGGGSMIAWELDKSGPMSRAEKLVALVFITVAILWMTRPLLADFIPNISDTGIAIFGAVLMFLLPVSFRRLEFVLEWRDTARLPWGVLILFGGGLSLAAGITSTGLADWFGLAFGTLHWLPVLILVVLALLVTVFLTEVTSNTATAAAVLPILASVATTMGYDPMLLAVPAAIAASCAFMLPVATPPNAIVYGSGLVSIPQMAKAGVVLNILMIVVITALMYLLLGMVFDVVWASGANT